MADKYKGLTVIIDGDTTKLGAALKDATDKSVACSRELKELDKALKFDPKNTELLTQKQQVLAEAISVSEQKIKTMKEAQKKLQEQVARGEIGEAQYRAFVRELLEAENRLKHLKTQETETGKALKEGGNEAKNAGQEIEKAGKKSKDAAGDTNKLTGEVKDLSQAYKDAKDEAKKAGDEVKSAAGALAKTGAAIVAGGTAAAVSAMSYDDALANIEAKTGASVTQMQSYQRVLDELYEGGYGEDLNDIASAMAQMINVTGEADSSALQKTLENAITLRDVYDFDIAESLRAATMLEKQFGVSGQEAYNLIVQGAQNGLNKNGDMLDVLNEYAAHYAQLGFSAEQMFGSLINGANSGAFTVDKVGDAMKEFGIRTKDTSTTSAEAFLGLGYAAENSKEYIKKGYKSLDDLQARFAAGGQEAQDAMKEVTDKLFAMEDEVQQNLIGVGLFGTMWEDLGRETVISLTDTQTELDRTKDAMEQVKAVKMDTMTRKWEQMGRKVQSELITPLGERLLPTLERFVNYASSNMDKLLPKIKAIAVAVGTALLVKQAGQMVGAIGKLVSAYQKLKTAAQAAQTAQSGTWWGLALTAVSLLIGGLAAAKNESMEAEAAQRELENAYLDAAKAAMAAGDAQREAARKVDDEFDTYEELWKELQALVDENGKVKEGYEDRVDYIRGELSNATGEEIEMVDGVIQKYADLCSTMDELLLKRRAARMLESQSAGYEEAVALVNSTEKNTDDNYLSGSQAALESQRAKVADLEAEISPQLNAYYENQTAYAKALADKNAFERNLGDRSLSDLPQWQQEYYKNLESELEAAKDAKEKSDKWYKDEGEIAEKRLNSEKLIMTDLQVAFDRNMATISTYEQLEKASIDGTAEELSAAMDATRYGLMTADSAAVSSLRRQEGAAASKYNESLSWSKVAGSTITPERIAEDYAHYLRTLSETYRGLLQDPEATIGQRTNQEEKIRAVLEGSGIFTADQIHDFLTGAADNATPLGELFGAEFAEGVSKALPQVTDAITTSLVSAALGFSVRNKTPVPMAYAAGTRNAKRGYAIVGENGPELAYFEGGETVLNAKDTMSALNIRSQAVGRGAALAARLTQAMGGGIHIPALALMAESRNFAPQGNFSFSEYDFRLNELSDRLDKILYAVENLELQPVMPVDELVKKSVRKTDRALGDISARAKRGQLL